MAEWVYARFEDVQQAETARQALVDFGLRAEDMNVLVNESTKDEVDPGDSQPTFLVGSGGSSTYGDPLGNSLRQSTPTHIPSVNEWPVEDNAETQLDPSGFGHTVRLSVEVQGDQDRRKLEEILWKSGASNVGLYSYIA